MKNKKKIKILEKTIDILESTIEMMIIVDKLKRSKDCENKEKIKPTPPNIQMIREGEDPNVR